jgi:hypothetical protein
MASPYMQGSVSSSHDQIDWVLTSYIRPDFWRPITAGGRTALDAVVTRQAEIIAYVDDYRLSLIATLAVIPLLIVFKKPPGRAVADSHAVID